MALKAGVIPNWILENSDEPDVVDIEQKWTNSMAEAMETAFKAEWFRVMETDPPESNDQFRVLLVAVAQGVVRHIVDNASAFRITVSPAGDHTHQLTITGSGGGTYDTESAGEHEHSTSMTINKDLNSPLYTEADVPETD